MGVFGSCSLARGDFPLNRRFLSECAGQVTLGRFLKASLSLSLARLSSSFSVIGCLFSFVGKLLAVVGDQIALVRDAIALVGKPLAPGQRLLARVKLLLTPIAEAQALLVQSHCICDELRRSPCDLGADALDLDQPVLIAPLKPVGAQALKLSPVVLEPRPVTLEVGVAALQLGPIALTTLIPACRRGFVALRAGLMGAAGMVMQCRVVRH
jgi:hypothetical protein